MIDLKNTKIDCTNENGNVNESVNLAYIKACEKQGIKLNVSLGSATGASYLYATSQFSPECGVEYSGKGSETYFLQSKEKQITLADLKPKKTVPFLQTGESFEHTKTLNFILERMINVHGEHENVDYIHKLRNAIVFVEAMEGSVNTDVECSKQKKTKVEFALIDKDAGDGKYWEVVRDFAEKGNVHKFVNGNYPPVKGNDELLSAYKQGLLYRKVETEITWKDALCDYVDECKKMEIDTTLSFAACVNGADWDNEFIEMCRVVIAAVDGK